MALVWRPSPQRARDTHITQHEHDNHHTHPPSPISLSPFRPYLLAAAGPALRHLLGRRRGNGRLVAERGHGLGDFPGRESRGLGGADHLACCVKVDGGGLVR